MDIDHSDGNTSAVERKRAGADWLANAQIWNGLKMLSEAALQWGGHGGTRTGTWGFVCEKNVCKGSLEWQ